MFGTSLQSGFYQFNFSKVGIYVLLSLMINLVLEGSFCINRTNHLALEHKFILLYKNAAVELQNWL